MVTDTKDVIINQLKREVSELRRNQENYNELVAKIESVEHLNAMITDEKRRVELEAQAKSNQSIEVIGNMRADIDTANLRISELEYEVANVTK